MDNVVEIVVFISVNLLLVVTIDYVDVETLLEKKKKRDRVNEILKNTNFQQQYFLRSTVAEIQKPHMFKDVPCNH